MLPLLFAMFTACSCELCDSKLAPLQLPKEEIVNDLSGIYSLDSKGNYVGVVTIRKTGKTYLLLSAIYHVTDDGIGTIQMKGVGIKEGDFLIVGWNGNGQTAVTRYKISGKTLRGRYATFPGDGQVHDETLVLKGKLTRD